MDMARFGMIVRALRRRRGWRQSDLGRVTGVSQELTSLIERDHGDRAATRTLRAVAEALDARLVVDLRWRAGDLKRLLDADHARVGAAMMDRLRRTGWESRVEVTYAAFRATGSVDILAWHPVTRNLLVVEDTSTNRRRVGGSAALFDAALPLADGDVRRWLTGPIRAMAGRLFVSRSSGSGGIQTHGGRHRVRRTRRPSNSES